MSTQSKKTLRTVLIVLFAVIFCMCLYVVIRLLSDYKAGGDIYEKAQSEFTSALSTVSPDYSEATQASPISVDFKSLKETCPDAVGWILIEDTGINYPVVQGGDNEKYLHTTYDGQENISGTIFVDSRQSADFSEKNTIIYGHNMENGTMFAGLTGYYDQSFYDEHKYVFIITESEILTYEVFSAYAAEDDGEAYTRTFETPEAFRRFLDGTARNSWLITDVRPSVQDKVITLSTCTMRTEKERFVVHAKLIQNLRKEEPRQ